MMVKPKRRKKSKIYFGKDVQDAIIRFNELGDDSKAMVTKGRLFEGTIYPAFMKLAEVLINMNSWKFNGYDTTFEDLQSDVVSFLYTKIPGYDPEKGRAYSYFTIITRNFLIQYSKKMNELKSRTAEVEYADYDRDVVNEVSQYDYRESLRDFIYEWCEWMDTNMYAYFKSHRDLRIADALVELLRNAEDIDIYNKKIIYVLIRERADVDTQHITKVVNTFKTLFTTMFEDYVDGKIVESSYTYM